MRHLLPPASPPRSPPLQARPRIIETVAQRCERFAAMLDAIGEISGMREQPSGIQVS
jgi:glutamate-5-semialdehyde dehydrogenase